MRKSATTHVNPPHFACRPSLVITEEDRLVLINSLDLWTFEPHKLTSDDCLACTLLIFDSLYHIEGFKEAIGIDLCEYYPSLPSHAIN